jgi:hypothetical protein
VVCSDRPGIVWGETLSAGRVSVDQLAGVILRHPERLTGKILSRLWKLRGIIESHRIDSDAIGLET